jgi:ATP-binding cassette, subfamily B, bacterial
MRVNATTAEAQPGATNGRSRTSPPPAPRGVTAAQAWRPDPRRHAPPLRRLVAESVRLAWRAGRRELVVMILMQVAVTVAVVAEVLVARSLLARLLDADRTGGGVGTLLPQVAAIAALTAGLGIANAVALHRQRLLAELCARHGEEQVLAVTGSVELAAFDEPAFHDAVARALWAVRLLPAVVASLSAVMRALAGAIGAVIALLVIQPLLAPVVLLVAAPLALAARRRGRAFYRFAVGVTAQDRERRYLAETLADRDAAKEVRAYGLFGFLAKRHDALWDERIGALRRVADRQLAFSAVADVAAGLILSGALVVLIALALSGDIGLAGAGAAAAALLLLGQRVIVVSSSTASLSEAALFMDDYLAVVGTPAPAPSPQPAARSPRPVLVRAENVTFSYAGARGPALRDVSLEIAPGEVVALVGENGSGKTTLAKLLAGLYVPEGGRIEPDRDELRRNVAVVFQDFMQYALTAGENIGLGRHERMPDDEGLRRAAEMAGAHDDLARLPDGYDTMLGPAFHGGTDLSVGQWQRIALARAVFRDAPFVILDEPTAALDARAESELFARIRELLAGRSVLLISHRFSSVRTADRIHVMSRGAIVETGTHDELIAHGGSYAELFRLQAAPYR